MLMIRVAMALLCVFALFVKLRHWLDDVRARGRRLKRIPLSGGRKAAPRKP